MIDSRVGMQLGVYNRLADLAFVVAILSALLFDRIPAFRVQIGAVGILAACIAAGTYLVKHWHPRPEKWCGPEASPVRKEAERQPHDQEERTYADLALRAQQLVAARQLQLRAMRLVWLKHHRHFAMQDDVVSRVLTIVDKLSTSQNAASYEFVLSPEGAFTIRVVDRAKMTPEATTAEQEGAGLPYEPALPN